ncbi:MAG: hypothetical protein K5745_07500 [Saccharofermentans sp.]|nr:hypothetical protein [Saccharofermentans sp.]
MSIRLKQLMLSIVAVMTIMAITSCSLWKSIEQITPDKKLSEEELARLVTEAVIDETQVADSYSKIPDSQLDEVSYTAFFEYVNILRGISLKHGEVDSFRILGDEATDEFFDSILSYSDDIKDFGSYGDLDVIELCYSEDQSKDLTNVNFVLRENDDGSYSLAGNYITDTILTYDFISHYFNMISEGNNDALCAILSPTYSSDIYLDSVINAKAEYIIDYYNLKVKSEVEDYEINCFAPMLVSYTIPKTLDTDGVSVVPHEVDLMVDSNGQFCLDDVIPVTYVDPVYLYIDGEKTLTCGSFYTNDSLEALLGEPLYSILPEKESDVLTDEDGEQLYSYLVIVSYNGLLLTFEAEYSSEDRTEWEGVLRSMRIYETTEPNIYSFNEEVTVGMNMAELLLIYPVIDEYDFVYTYEADGITYSMIPEFDDNNNITKLQCTVNQDT